MSKGMPSRGRLARYALLFVLIASWTCLVKEEESRTSLEADSSTRQLLSDFSRSLGRGGV